jgi:hypothetical protein
VAALLDKLRYFGNKIGGGRPILSLKLLCALLLCWTVSSFELTACAQEAAVPQPDKPVASPPSKPSVEFNLSSTVRFVPAGHCHEFHFADIKTGDSARTVIPQELLTPAEYVALHQVLLSGEQTIKINAAGKAVGGKFRVDKALADAIAELLVAAPLPVEDAAGMPSHAGKASVVADRGLRDDEFISTDGTSGIITGAAVVIGDRAKSFRRASRKPRVK